ncbi:MAG: HupE/UreJ family protein [Pseudomonadota bacterium]
MRSKIISPLIAIAALAFCDIAQAHPGHGGGFVAGVEHPLSGVDHLLAMIAVGIWAYQLGGRAKWLVPVCFVAIMAGAAGLGMAGVGLPMIEGGIAASLLVLGLLILFAVSVRPAVAGAIVAMFAVFHGYAHGAEMPAMASPWLYGTGFIVATAALHGLGLMFGRSVASKALILRAVGIAIATAGAWMMAA